MQTLDFMLRVAVLLLTVSITGYFLCLFNEKRNTSQNRISIKSKTLTESYLEKLDKKSFKLGKMKLSIGDEIKLRLRESNKTYRGKVLGVKKQKEKLCLLTDDDHIVEFRVVHIKKLKIVTRYGKII